LLRLVVQKLCRELGEKGRSINEDIGALVSKGLRPAVQKALDIVRVIGNDAVHPGQIDLRDDPGMAQALFGLVNVIVEQMITTPAQIAAIYEALPPEKLEQIKRRDEKPL